MQIDAAQLIQAVQDRKDPPVWLKSGNQIWVSHLGWVEVKAVIGLQLIVKGEKTSRISNWQEAIADKTISEKPDVIDEPPATNAEILIAESETQSSSELGQIKNPKFRQIAKELAYAELLNFTDVVPPEDSEFESIPAEASPLLRKALGKLGIESLYSHQVRAFRSLMAGRSIVLATPTASGKTLSYNPAVLNSCLESSATALYLFPLKALAKDQEEKLLEISAKMGNAVRIGTIDGDVPVQQRLDLFKATPQQPKGLQVLMQSPDSLHHQLYKVKKADEWKGWRDFLKNLRFVVVDEAHTYRGSFGGHFANLMLRLLNAVDEVGGDSAKVQFVFATATVANPAEMAGLFCGRSADSFDVIDKSGAGSRGRTTLCLEPSNQPNSDAAAIIELFFKYDLSWIVFCNSRNMAKNLLNLVRSNLEHKGKHRDANRIAVYYGGLKTDRRHEIISGLKSGKIQGIIATSALEAGIDLPALDAVLLNGYAGSLMAHRQRVGRAGRKNEGLVIFLPSDNRTLDAYYGNKPKELLYGQVEGVAFNPGYPVVLAQHLICAATEATIPLEGIDRFGPSASALVSSLVGSRKLLMDTDRVSGRGYPHKDVNIRGASADSIRLLDTTGDEIETMDVGTAYKEVHPGALYTLQGSKGELLRYRSHSLDVESRVAHLELLDKDPHCTTQASSVLLVKPASLLKPPQAFSLDRGELRMRLAWGTITDLVTGYQEIARIEEKYCSRRSCRLHGITTKNNICEGCRSYTSKRHVRKVIHQESFEKPYSTKHQAPILEMRFTPEVDAMMWGWVNSLKQEMTIKYGDDLPEILTSLWDADADYLAMHTMTHQLLFSLPLVVLASNYDLNVLVVKQSVSGLDQDAVDGQGDEPEEDSLKKGELKAYFYDTSDGGNGSAEALYDRFLDFVNRSHSMAESCDCGRDLGCPKCLIQNGCPQYNRALCKPLGLQVLESLMRNNRG